MGGLQKSYQCATKNYVADNQPKLNEGIKSLELLTDSFEACSHFFIITLHYKDIIYCKCKKEISI